MPTVDPRAILDDSQGPINLADDVFIGPWCVLRGPITLGSGTRLIASVHIDGPTTVGENNTFYPFCGIGGPPQDRSFSPNTLGAGLVIGHRNTFRQGATIDRATRDHPTTLGDDNLFMVNAHAGHDCVIGNRCTLANTAMLAGHVHVADSVTLGGSAAIHQFVRLGRLCMVSGVTGITQDVPPFCTAYEMRVVSSLNIVGLRRAGLRDHITPLKRAFDILYRSGLPNPRAIEEIERELGDNPLCREMADFVRTTQRGITHYRHGEPAEPHS